MIFSKLFISTRNENLLLKLVVTVTAMPLLPELYCWNLRGWWPKNSYVMLYHRARRLNFSPPWVTSISQCCGYLTNGIGYIAWQCLCFIKNITNGHLSSIYSSSNEIFNIAWVYTPRHSNLNEFDNTFVNVYGNSQSVRSSHQKWEFNDHDYK